MLGVLTGLTLGLLSTRYGGNDGDGGSLADVEVDTHDSDLGVGAGKDHVHLHSHAGTVVEMLAGQVEVELLELEGLVAGGHPHGAALADDLDGRAQVLKGSTGFEVRDLDGELRASHLCEGSGGHVDGGLVRPCCASAIGGSVQQVPACGSLFVRSC